MEVGEYKFEMTKNDWEEIEKIWDSRYEEDRIMSEAKKRWDYDD